MDIWKQFSDGVNFASEHSENDIEKLVELAKDMNHYGEFERGMEHYLKRKNTLENLKVNK